jgi:hypothetical protein
MKRLEVIADVVLANRPKPKSKAAKKRARAKHGIVRTDWPERKEAKSARTRGL